MTAFATVPLRIRPSLGEIERVIVELEEGAAASRELDARVFAALGWRVTRQGCELRQAWTALSPLSRTPLPLPRASKRIDCARQVVPHGWDWSAGQRGGNAQAWCHNRRREGDPALLWFEALASTPALALLRCSLHAHRAEWIAAMTPIEPQLQCACGWQGPASALRAGSRCPDCERHI
ncbi:hypothetical protein [Elioraea sp.]|uniref:hypothetical protein n=1 Tax=Elioraea sp. TaxID=2185103 RepID=UPI0025C53E24|nr:hypothetical protein [Elioraea sp.]